MRPTAAPLCLLALLVCAPTARAGDDAERSQEQIAEQLGALAEAYSVQLDDDGNVIRFAASNHGMYRKDKDAPPRPGIDDDAIRRLRHFPKLQSVFIEKQPLSNEGWHSLAELPNVTDLRLHYANDRSLRDRKPPLEIDKRFALVVNDMKRPLKVLEIKHNFRIHGGVMDQLKPQPELEKLELDTGFCGPEAVDFIVRSPKVRNLQLHRTSIGDADFQKVIAALPKLEVLEVRPTRAKTGDRLTGHSLRALRNHPSLQYLYLGINWPDLTYDDGLEHLATVADLKVLDLSGANPKPTLDSPDIQKLIQARPDLTIILPAGRKHPGADGDRRFPRDEHYRWGVTS